MKDELHALITYRIRQAQDALLATEKLLEAKLWKDSINSAYYAEFYTVMAILALKGLGSSKHSGVISLFDREFVKTGIFPKGYSKMIHRAFDMRQEADYEELSTLGKEEALRRFGEAILEWIRESGDIDVAIPELAIVRAIIEEMNANMPSEEQMVEAFTGCVDRSTLDPPHCSENNTVRPGDSQILQGGFEASGDVTMYVRNRFVGLRDVRVQSTSNV